MRHPIRASLLISLATGFIACDGGSFKSLAHEWKMEEDSTVVLDLKGDSSFVFTEQAESEQGKWQISQDGKSVILSFNSSPSQPWRLRILDRSSYKLVLYADESDTMKFSRHKE
jgi:hypothetical protein